MSNATAAKQGNENNNEPDSLHSLESQIDELLALTQVLSKENHALRTQQRNWSTERAKLIEKNELAKSRVESMISRLKALEKDKA